MNSYLKEYEEINKSMGSTQEISEISSKLTSAMDVLPEMTEKKAKVDMHVDIASKILSEIKRRSIDKL